VGKGGICPVKKRDTHDRYLPFLDVADAQLNEEKIQSVIDTNTTAVILCSRLAISSMKKHGFDGHVVNISR
jgi:NAD(P)-dependent dehydrogenase (short-subunit alcohol dehydrogenase family)